MSAIINSIIKYTGNIIIIYRKVIKKNTLVDLSSTTPWKIFFFRFILLWGSDIFLYFYFFVTYNSKIISSHTDMYVSMYVVYNNIQEK